MDNSVIDLMYLAKQNRVDILWEDGRLQLKAPKNADKNLLEEIKKNKELIINFFEENQRTVKKYNKVIKADRYSLSPIPLSYSQERLWFIDQMEGSVGYHIPSVLRLRGSLNKEALRRALKEVVNRHEVLRTVYREQGGEPMQEIRGKDSWELEEATVDEEALQGYIEQKIRAPFDLSQDHMLRATLIDQGESEHLLVVTMHHIASDGWSMPVIVKEVASLYRSYSENRVVALQPLELQYSDYAIWQRNYLKGEALEKKLGYWRRKLAGITPLELPIDYPRPLIQSTRGSSVKFNIEKELADQLQELCRREEATLFMLLLSGLNILLYRYSGQEDISVGTPVANRGQQEIEELVGFFVNTLALRNEVRGDKSCKELLQEVRATMLEAYEHQEVPFEKVVEAIVKERDLGRSPLFQVMLVLQNTPDTGKVELGGLQLSGEPVAVNTSKFELTISINETNSGLQGSVDYNTDLFKEETIVRLAGHFKTLLGSIVQTPGKKISKLKMLSAAEEHQLLKEYNDTTVDYPRDKSIIDLFEAQAIKTPGAIAVVFEEEETTYKELNEKSNQLANYLRSKGVRSETLVPVCMERGADMITAILGILKSGGAYVPIDPEYPEDRIRYMLEDTGAKIVLSREESSSKLKQIATAIEVIAVNSAKINKEPAENPAIKIKPDQLAYVIYTSGSTGKPKGVMIEHRAVLDHCFGLIESADLSTCKSFALFAPLVFDAGHAIIFSSLFLGAALNVLPKELIVDGEKLEAYLEKHPVDCIKIVPSVWLSYINGDNIILANKVMIFGGEGFPSKIQEHLFKLNYQGITYNHYGPTEATIGKTIHKIDLQKQYATLPIGKPFSNTQLYIVDSWNQLVPIGVAGELYIAGEGLARGYLNRSELTTEKFIANPFTPNSDLKAYKTGDKARWNEEGEVEYLGRMDEQVKIRGHRIELGEIENALAGIEGVQYVALNTVNDSQGNKILAAYVVAEGDFNKENIITGLREKLPEYMIPAAWVKMDQLPLTSNGKVDKKALPYPGDVALLSKAKECVAPRNEVEKSLSEIWQELLNVDNVGVYDNFFELGGHSLLVTRLISIIRKRLNAEVSIKSLFLYPTVGQLAEYIAVNNHLPLLPIIIPGVRPSLIPLSFSQERLWFIDQLEGSVQYHLPTVLRLRGEVDKGALNYSLEQVVNRHEALRTVFKEQEGVACQYLKPEGVNQLQITDGSKYSEDKKGLEEYIQRLIKAPFDLSRDNMLRVTLIELGLQGGASNSVLVATMHHIASDAWSASILVKEVVELYNAYIEQRPFNLPELEVQYADYSIWQRNYLQGELLGKKISYWKEKLGGVSVLQLPTDYKRAAIQSSKGSVAAFRIDKELSEQLYHLSKKEGTTLFITLQAVYKAMLYRYSGQEDISVGTSIARREQQQLEGLIGFFVNTLALRDQVKGEQSFRELLQQVRTTTMEAYEHQEVPFEKVVETVIKERDKSRSPLFQVMLVLRNTPEVPELKLGEVVLSAEGHEHTSVKFELTFFINETQNGLQGAVQYCSDLYSAATIERMTGHFAELLRSIVKNPEEKIGKLGMLSAKEKQTIEKEYNKTAVSYPKEKSIVTLFEEQAAKTPQAVAVVFGEERLTYKELNEKSNQVARHLRSKGIKEEALIPLFIERSAAMITGMLGILKAGGAYVPIDTEFPGSRISYMVKDTQAKLIVSSKQSIEKLKKIQDIEEIETIAIDQENSISKESKENLATRVRADQLAYVIYTSGSTGQPKGAMITHRNLTDYVYGLKAATKIEECKSFALVSTIATDLGNTVLYSSLLTGGALHIFTREASSDIYGLHRYFKDHQVECLKIVPSHWKALSKEEELLLPKKLLVFGGEALQKEVAEQIEASGASCKVVNHYGPTETTIGKLLHVVEPGRKYNNTIPIGKPFSNTRVYVLSREMEICPTGVPGQLYIGGQGVSVGYVNNEALTKEKFIEDAFSEEKGAKMYVTGDMVKYLEDGNIEFIGRADDQVKIRGYRVELGEIESILQQSEQIRQAVVVAKEDSQGNKRLIGYIVSREEFNKEQIENYLENKLPDYMIPQVWVALETFPLTANGKIDRKALPEPESQSKQGGYEAPRNETEEKLAEIWQEILEVEQVSIHDDFFELGGHSLLAVRMVYFIERNLSISIPINVIFEFTTINELSKYLELQPQVNIPEEKPSFKMLKI